MNKKINKSGELLNINNIKIYRPRRLFGFVKDAGA